MTLEYNDAGDLVRMADPLGNETVYQTDGAGRRIRITDPLGFDTRTEYNGIDQITRTIDPLAQETRLTYDPAQRLASVIDPRNNAIESYQYDSGDRVTAVTDALNRAGSRQYDSAGRLSQLTDRKGQVTTYSYDNLDRVTTIHYPGGSRSIDYDAVGRVSRVAEPGSAVRYSYDAVDRVVSVTTDSVAGQHTVGYDYDTLDRVTRRTLNGADPTDYTWDNASRLATIVYRGQTTTYTWDGANRLTHKTLPNGIKQTYTYDNADRLLSIAYQKADNTPIETITYTYDAKGQRLTKAMSGASARETAFSATYNAANRMTQITLPLPPGEGTGVRVYSLGYDDNGNLVSKTDTSNASNTTTYAWDSRNRLSGISAPGLSAGFAYDALGRRIEKTVNGNTVNYVYDGMQAMAEVTGGSVSASLLTGLNLDEVLARYAASGNRTYLTDALNSVIAQANDTQAIENYYTYTPYGETQTLGPDGGNPIQYTGRENDQTGLYYYRARYYDPVLKRFVSEDPIGLVGGVNFYAYVNGDPASLSDPLGLWSISIEGYAPWGGGIVFGRDPNSGGGFMTIRGGVGIGGGIKWDPLGGRPGSRTEECKTGGWGIGGFGDVGGNAGPIQAGLQSNAGINFPNRIGFPPNPYGQLPTPSFGLGDSVGIKAVAAAGVELTFFSPKNPAGKSQCGCP